MNPRPHTDYDVRQRTWVLLTDWEGRVNGWAGRIPAGFLFDLASIPKPLWVLLGPHELSVLAPLVHDWVYRTHPLGMTRSEADRLFLLAMTDEGVGRFRRRAAWLAVRLFGWFAWPTNKPDGWRDR